jgi:hypothetical protein
MHEAECHWRIARMREAPLPFDEQNLVMLIGEHQLLDCAIEKVGDDAIDRTAVTFDENPRLAGCDEFGIVSPSLQRSGDFY